MGESVRALIVDDSSFARLVLGQILSSDDAIEVVGEAADGAEAFEKTQELKPDLITMDINMPGTDGLEAIEEIMAYYPTPILVVSSTTDANIAYRAISAGALEVVEKPVLDDASNYRRCNELIEKVKLLARVRVITHISGRHRPFPKPLPLPSTPTIPHVRKWKKIVLIGSSTGGPKALSKILHQLPANFPAPVVIVQHISNGFTEGLVEWLNDVSSLPVEIARSNLALEAGHIYIAPNGSHTQVFDNGTIYLDSSSPVGGHRPAVDVLFLSAARAYGKNCVGVILTGMGADGAKGILEIRKTGGRTIAQNQETCVVYGMPRSAVELGGIEISIPIDKIAREIIKAVA